MNSTTDKGKKRSSSNHASSSSSNAASKKPRSNDANQSNGGDTDADGKKLKTKKRLPKNKRRQIKNNTKVGKTRDFSADLEEYIQQWEARNDGSDSWKFNKILQAWALDHCFDKKRIDSKLFKLVLPYLITVQGGAVERLASRAASILSTDKSDIVNDDEDTAPAADETKDADKNAANDDDEEDDENAVKKVVVVTKSMAHRAKKIQRGLTA